MIKYLKFVCFFLACFTLISCEEKNPDNNNNPGNNNPNSNTNENLTPKQVYERIITEINNKNSYLIETSGNTETKVLFTYTQETNTKVYYFDNSVYNETSSTSTLVERHHKFYFKDNSIAYYDSKRCEGNEIKKSSVDEYLDIFGRCHNKNEFFDLKIDDNSITNIYLNGNIITIHLNDKSVEKNKIQMKEFGGLNDYPIFNSIKLEIYFDNNYNVNKFISYQDYQISMFILGTVNCKQKLTSLVSYNFDYPNVDKFK